MCHDYLAIAGRCKTLLLTREVARFFLQQHRLSSLAQRLIFLLQTCYLLNRLTALVKDGYPVF